MIVQNEAHWKLYIFFIHKSYCRVWLIESVFILQFSRHANDKGIFANSDTRKHS